MQSTKEHDDNRRISVENTVLLMAADHERHSRYLLEKVTVRLEPSDWYDHSTETLWARPLGNGTFQIQNVPFYAYGVSYDDVVDVAGESNVVRSILKRHGHSTYRIFVSNEETLTRFQEFWSPLEHAGCTLERATMRLFAVDVPPETDIYAVYAMLKAGEEASVWDFEEGHVGHNLKPH